MSDDLDSVALLQKQSTGTVVDTIELTTHNNGGDLSSYDDIDLLSTNKYNNVHTKHIDIQSADTITSVDTNNVPYIVQFIESLHPKAHYGYFIVPLGACIQVLGNAGTTLGMGYYTEYLMSELDLSRSTVSGLWAIALFGSSFLMPFTGRAFDKLGARFTAMLTLPFYVLSFILFSYVSNVYMLIIVFFMFRIFKSVYQQYSAYIVNQWFVNNKGVAMTVYQCLGTFGLLYPLLLSTIESYTGSWRTQLIVLAVLHAVIGSILCSMGVNNPERIGRLPDLKRHDAVSNDNNDIERNQNNHNTTNNDTEEIHWMYQDAIRSPLFWTVIAAYLTVALLWSGYNFNYKAMWRLQGLTENVEELFTTIAIFNFISLAIAGIMFDKIENKARGMAVGSAGCFAAAFCLSQSHTHFGAQIFSMFMGFQDGFFQTGYLTVYAYSFGRVDLGTIDALAGSIMNMIVGFAPLLCGMAEDYFHSFTIIYYGLMSVSAVATIALLLSKKPTPPPVERRLSLIDNNKSINK